MEANTKRLAACCRYVPTDLKHHLDNNCPSGFSTEMLLKYSRQLVRLMMLILTGLGIKHQALYFFFQRQIESGLE